MHVQYVHFNYNHPVCMYRDFQVRCHKKATRIGACTHFGGNFEWGITRMRGFSSLFCDNGPEKPCMFTVITPRAHARARGYVIGRGVYCILYIVYYILSALFFGTNLLSSKILTFRSLFEHR